MFWKRKKKRTYLIFGTSRGKSVPLGKVEATNPDELIDKIIEILQNRPDSGSFKHIKIIDAETQQQLRLSNPFAEDQEEEASREQRRGGSKGSSAQDVNVNAIIDLMSKIHGSILDATVKAVEKSIELIPDIYNKAFSKAMETISTFRPQYQQSQESKSDLDRLMELIIALLQARARMGGG